MRHLLTTCKCALGRQQIGFTTVDPSLGEKYAAKCERKDRETTTATLGFRLGGMQARRAARNPF